MIQHVDVLILTCAAFFNINLCCIMEFEAKTYKNQRKGFAEVTDNFYYKFVD